MAKITENSAKVLNYLQAAGAGVKFTVKDVQTALGFEKAGAVVGSVRGFEKKGLIERFVESVEDENGKIKEVKYFALNEAGVSYNPEDAE
jgi:hypothetical protein